jgi:hypothetical protein
LRQSHCWWKHYSIGFPRNNIKSKIFWELIWLEKMLIAWIQSKKNKKQNIRLLFWAGSFFLIYTNFFLSKLFLNVPVWHNSLMRYFKQLQPLSNFFGYQHIFDDLTVLYLLKMILGSKMRSPEIWPWYNFLFRNKFFNHFFLFSSCSSGWDCHDFSTLNILCVFTFQ